jgi:hypothetical protein
MRLIDLNGSGRAQMTLTKTAVILFTAIAVGGATLALIPTTNSAPIGENERTMIKEALLRPSPLKAETFVHMSFEGSMQQVGEFNSKLRQELEAQKVSGVGPNDRPYLVLHGNPDKTQVLRMDLGFEVSRRPEVKTPLMISKLDFAKTARVPHQGAYKELSGVGEELLKQAGGRAQEETFVLHLLEWSATNPEAIRTELIVPLR